MAAIWMSHHARQDFDQIWAFIASRRPTHADKLVWQFDKVFKTLSKRSAICLKRNDLHVDLYQHQLRNFLILFRISSRGIEVVRLLSSVNEPIPG